MANDSTVNLKMVFEILTDKEIEELKERSSGCGIFTPQIYCTGKQGSDPSRWRSRFNRRLCAAKRPASCWGFTASWNGANAAGWLTPVRPGKRLTLFKRNDIEARAQLRVFWGELL